MNKKTVGIKELKESYPKQYDKAYQEYCTAQWEFPMDSDWYVEGLNETPWLDVDAVHYSVGYCQSDYAYFTGKVYLDKFLEVFDKEDEYFVLREAMKLKDCADQMFISSSARGGSEVFDDIEWWGADDGYFDSDAVVKSYGQDRSVLEGMNYGEYYSICQELLGDLYGWVKNVCEQMMRKLYMEIRDDLDHQMSEESFEEWAESMGEEFEVEIDDEDDDSGYEADVEGRRLAA